MRDSSALIVKDLVLVGGGHSHVSVLKSFGMNPMPGVRVTVVSRDVHTPYSGMLPGFIAGHYDFDDVHIDLNPLSVFAGARLVHDEVIGVDLERKTLKFAERPPLSYDVLSFNIGSTPRVSHVPGAEGRVVPVKPINKFIDRWAAFYDRVRELQRPPRIAVVGAGAGGVELTLAIQHRFQSSDFVDGSDFHLFAATETILATHNPSVRRRFERILSEREVSVHTGTRVVEVRDGCIVTDSGQELEFDEILWVTNAGAAKWLQDSKLELSSSGFISVDATLQSVSHPGVFAAGDVADVREHPREKAGVFAVRQGKPLTDNLRLALRGLPPKPFKPQSKFLSLISMGGKRAVASRGTWCAEGDWVWTWKDRIDRKFMRKFSELPEMDEASSQPEIQSGLAGAEQLEAISAVAMRCGGCGAKVGASVLDRVIRDLRPFQRDDVVVGLDSPDDAAVTRVPAGKVVLQTVDMFRAFVDDPWIFSRIAVIHSLGDIYAMGAEPATAMALTSVPYGVESQVERTLRELMSGAVDELNRANVTLVGGHTSEGAELSLGFSVTGYANPDELLTKGGLREGQDLILTKALGTGTLFAAQMRKKAKGRWIDTALESMLLSPRDAVDILREFRATACTDVTGFGLLGHLVEMARASQVGVRLDLDRLPILPGAEETAAAGILSSLQPQNVRLRRAIANIEERAGHSLYPLIFDPQTAGGLLASLPSDRSAECVAKLRAAGYVDTAIIGSITPAPSSVEMIRLDA